MKSILIFSGTTEGKRLAKVLSGANVPAVVCVATEYGKEVMKQLPFITVHQGRMDAEEMRKFMEGGEFSVVVDATHPFAVRVSENIKESARIKNIPYLRLKRNTDGDKENRSGERYFPSNAECEESLSQTEGNILLTTGSNELALFCRRKEIRERLYARVLPSEESIRICKECGLSGKQIIAMQGPFTKEMNLAMLQQYDIKIMVTKESGAVGGFFEKADAAAELGISLYVIGNPEKQEGLSFSNICGELEKIVGVPLKKEKQFLISLVGIGMGDMGMLTLAAKERIENADVLFGAKRLLSGVSEWGIKKEGKKFYPYYLPKDVVPILENEVKNFWEEEKESEKEVGTFWEEEEERKKEAVILFSGDTGFYSGCNGMYQKLKEWEREVSQDIEVRIYPGISSVSYFASVLGTSWQDAKIISIHGRTAEEGWEMEVLSAVREHEKVFLLVSGVEDVQKIGKLMEDAEFGGCRLMVGYQLSYPEEKIMECTPRQCEEMKEEGLYIVAVLHQISESEKSDGVGNSHGFVLQDVDEWSIFLRSERKRQDLFFQKKDEDFIRGNVPMTKEEIRGIIIRKLRLKEGAAVCDVGSGTGSVAVEIAGCSDSIRVYAIEMKEEGVQLIKANREKFKLSNIEVIEGEAPECLGKCFNEKEVGQIIPSHAFIGGSNGNLKEILEFLYLKNPNMRIVITAVSLETVGELARILNRMPVTEEEMMQIQVSKARKTGKYHLMQAENPVYICSFNFSESPISR